MQNSKLKIMIILVISIFLIITEQLGSLSVSEDYNKKIIQLVPPLKGVYLGAWNQDSVGRALFENLIGCKAPLWSGGFDHLHQDRGTEGTKPRIDISWREKLFKDGYITTYGIEAVVQRGEMDSEPQSFADKVTPQDIIDGKIDAELKEVARAIADFAKPILWLYQREPYLQFGGYGQDGTWTQPMCDYRQNRQPQCSLTAMFGDKNKLDGPERYIAVARHIHDVVETEIKHLGKGSPIIWVMGALSEGERNHPGFYTEYFPGIDYVDWHAFNWYPGTEEREIEHYESISQSLGWKEAMALDAEKPVLILEFGVSANHGDRSKWFKSFFDDVRMNPAMKNLIGFIYWQESKGTFTGNYVNLNTLLPQNILEEKVWKEELKKYPEYWNGTLRFAE